MEITPIIVAIISGVVSAFGAILVYIGNEKNRKQKIAETHAEQLKEVENNIKKMLDVHRGEYLTKIDKISERLDDVETNITNMQAVYQQNTAVIEYKIEALSNHVNKHNDVITRTFNLEAKTEVIEEKIKVANNRIADLEKK